MGHPLSTGLRTGSGSSELRTRDEDRRVSQQDRVNRVPCSHLFPLRRDRGGASGLSPDEGNANQQTDARPEKICVVVRPLLLARRRKEPGLQDRTAVLLIGENDMLTRTKINVRARSTEHKLTRAGSHPHIVASRLSTATNMCFLDIPIDGKVPAFVSCSYEGERVRKVLLRKGRLPTCETVPCS